MESTRSARHEKSFKVLEARIRERAAYIIRRLGFDKGRFILAGGCLTEKINDVDIFHYDGPKLRAPGVATTPNATTYATKPWPVQLCNYTKPSLEELVESFDFAHIQVGVIVEDGYIGHLYYSEAYVAARLTGETWYTGSEYPLSSLFRHEKYKQRGLIKNIKSKLNILAGVYQRGFYDYPDFKDQLDAVDLGLLPEEYEDCQAELLAFFETLRKPKPQPEPPFLRG